MLRSAGHTIFFSGFILCLTFVCIVFMPLDFIAVTGIGSSISIALSLLVNLTVTPCLLLAFPTFFSNSVQPFVCCGRRFTYGTNDENRNYEPLIKPTLGINGEDSLMSTKELEDMQSSCWYRLGNMNVRFGTGLLCILIVLAFVLPAGVFCWSYVASDALIQG
jgi:uncharacterized membrane protein YdfJ with MMPL/SSD domain